MLQGAPLLKAELTGDLKQLVDDKSAIIAGWVASGKLAPVRAASSDLYDLGLHSALC
jgi:hypothetical protein